MVASLDSQPRIADAREIEPRTDGTRTFVYVATAVAIAVGIVVGEWYLYRKCFFQYVAPFFPGQWDQIGIYCNIYQMRFTICAGEWPSHLMGWLTGKAAMKGILVDLLGAISTTIFGVHRFAAAQVNFLFLAAGEICLAFAIHRRYGASAALLAVGLFLASMTNYLDTGGIFDLRLDYAGMVAMGFAFLAALAYLEKGGKARLTVAALAMVLGTMTRSLILFYLNAASFSLFALTAAIGFLNKRQIGEQPLCQRALALWIAACVELGLFLIVYWQPFSAYYLNRVTSGETGQWSEFYGSSSYLQTLLFNVKSLSLHFNLMTCLAAAALITAIILVRKRERAQQSKGGIEATMRGFTASAVALFFISLLVTTVAIISCFMPSAHSAGVLTIPLAVSLACLIAEVSKGLAQSKIWQSICVLIFAAGFCCFAWQMRHPSYAIAPSPEMARIETFLNQILVNEIKTRENPVKIHWVLANDALVPSNLLLYWNETEQRPNADYFWGTMPQTFKTYSWNETRELITGADTLVVPSDWLVSHYGFIGQQSVIDVLPKVRNVVKAEFEEISMLEDEQHPPKTKHTQHKKASFAVKGAT